MSVLSKAALPLLVASSLLTGCATHSDGSAPLNQRNWPLCSLLGGLVGGGLGAIESSSWAAGAGVAGAIAGGLICYAQDGDEDGDGVFDRRDRCPDTPAGTAVDVYLVHTGSQIGTPTSATMNFHRPVLGTIRTSSALAASDATYGLAGVTYPTSSTRGLASGDTATVAVLEIILREEVAHVAAGTRWFRWCCERDGVEPVPTFRQLLREHAAGVLRRPFNVPARRAAGFDDEDMAVVEALAEQAR